MALMMKQGVQPMRKWIAVLVFFLVMNTVIVFDVQAQNNGQFCVRAYEDTNGNMIRDPGEPLLESGIIISLYDMRGVIINTASLEASPTREQGLVCFSNLPDGQYALFVDSVYYRATTTENMVAQLNATSQLAVLEYGGQRLLVDAPSAILQPSPQTEFTPNWERVGIATLAGAGTTLLVGFLGFLLHLLFIRPHNRRVRQQASMLYAPPSTPYAPNPSVTPRKNYYEYEDIDEFTT